MKIQRRSKWLLSFEEDNDKHSWKLGKVEKHQFYGVRRDTCELCGCIRSAMVSLITGIPLKPFSYTRSGMGYGVKPDCWRHKTPV